MPFGAPPLSPMSTVNTSSASERCWASFRAAVCGSSGPWWFPTVAAGSFRPTPLTPYRWIVAPLRPASLMASKRARDEQHVLVFPRPPPRGKAASWILPVSPTLPTLSNPTSWSLSRQGVQFLSPKAPSCKALRSSSSTPADPVADSPEVSSFCSFALRSSMNASRHCLASFSNTGSAGPPPSTR